jgi:hypothetical protein
MTLLITVNKKHIRNVAFTNVINKVIVSIFIISKAILSKYSISIVIV